MSAYVLEIATDQPSPYYLAADTNGLPSLTPNPEAAFIFDRRQDARELARLCRQLKVRAKVTSLIAALMESA